MCHRQSLSALLCLMSVLLFLPAARAADDSWQHEPYQLGQGLRFPALGLDVGGYLSLQYEHLHHRTPAFSVQDLSLFVSKRLGARWNLFTEMEVGDALKVTDQGQVNHETDFDIERLYADYRADPAVTLRLGKFLTPVGRWNMIHADPLVWTVSRPLTTEAPFARHASGAMLYGSVPAAGHDLDYWLFVDDSDLFDPQQRREPAFDSPGATNTAGNSFRRGIGARLLYHFLQDRWRVGASYLHFRMQDEPGERDLFGLDFYWDAQPLELSGEAVYRSRESLTADETRGAYLQAVLPLPAQLYLVARHERYRTELLADPVRLNTLGLTYRPRPPVSLKLEFHRGSGNDSVAPDGWLTSLAVMF